VDALNKLLWYFWGMDTTPISVLVIESHPMMREALRNAIAVEPGLTLAEPVFDCTQTLWMAIAAQPDTILLAYKPEVILLALGNPGENEMETLITLRKSLPDTPILALTSNEVTGQEQMALEAGAQAVLTKASPRAELIEKLRELGSEKTLKNTNVTLQQEALIEVSV
jgi:DNA-binding NarL/FixJ family response regulator